MARGGTFLSPLFPLFCWCSLVLGCCCMRRRMTSALAALQKIPVPHVLTSCWVWMSILKICFFPLPLHNAARWIHLFAASRKKFRLFKEMSRNKCHRNEAVTKNMTCGQMTKHSCDRKKEKSCCAQETNGVISPYWMISSRLREKDIFTLSTTWLSDSPDGYFLQCTPSERTHRSLRSRTGFHGYPFTFRQWCKKHPYYYQQHIYNVQRHFLWGGCIRITIQDKKNVSHLFAYSHTTFRISCESKTAQFTFILYIQSIQINLSIYLYTHTYILQ